MPGGCYHELALLYAADAENLICELSQFGATTFYNDDVLAISVVEMHVHCGHHFS